LEKNVLPINELPLSKLNTRLEDIIPDVNVYLELISIYTAMHTMTYIIQLDKLLLPSVIFRNMSGQREWVLSCIISSII